MGEELKVLEKLKEELGGRLLDSSYNSSRRVLIVKVSREAITKSIEVLKEVSGGELHLTSINGADLEDRFELTYFIWLLPQRLRVLVKVEVPREDLRVESASKVSPATLLYEREVHEMLGVKFEGHPKLERLFLPEDWPEEVYPLRRS